MFTIYSVVIRKTGKVKQALPVLTKSKILRTLVLDLPTVSERNRVRSQEWEMNYLYITQNKNAAQYAISLDEIFLTLYGFSKRKKLTSSITGKDVPGVVYRISVTPEQHDAVRDILCDFLMESHKYRYRLRRGYENFSSAEFITYILDRAGIINFDDSINGIAEEDLEGLAEFDAVDTIYEGDLKKYVAEKRYESEGSLSNIRHLNTVKKNKKVVEHGTAQYEYVPHEMQELMTAD